MSTLTPRGRGLGRKPDHPDSRDRLYAAVHKEPIVVTPQVDLRDRLPRCFDQGQTASCGPHAGAGLMCFLYPQVGGFSRLQIYFAVRLLEGDVDQDSGVETRDVMRILQITGAAPETLWPFDPAKLFVDPPEPVFEAAEKYTIAVYSRLNDADDYLACLAQGFPFLLGFVIFESLDGDAVAHSGVMPYPAAGERQIGGHDVLCIHGDTVIPLLDGTSPTIKELAVRSEPFWLYSCDENQRITAGLGHSARLTGCKDIIGVELDNGETIYCTPDHPFMMRDGSYLEAKELNPGASLMPLYRKVSKGDMAGYEMVLHPQSERWQFTHRVVASRDGPYDGVVHHRDFKKRNNDPSNLETMSWEDHTELHQKYGDLLVSYSQSAEGRERSRELMNALWSDPEWRAKQLIKLREFGIKNSKRMTKGQFGFGTGISPERHSELGRLFGAKNVFHLNTPASRKKRTNAWKDRLSSDEEFRAAVSARAIANLRAHNEKNKKGSVVLTEAQLIARRENVKKANAARQSRKINHSVVRVFNAGKADVYDLTVEKHHNFAVAAGVFVHNCVGYDLNFHQNPDFLKSGLDPSRVSNRALLIRNSWGTGWGLNGHFWMPLEFAADPDLGGDAWTARLSQQETTKMTDQNEPKVEGTKIDPDEITVAANAVRQVVNGIEYMGMNVGSHVSDAQCRALASAVVAAIENYRNAPQI